LQLTEKIVKETAKENLAEVLQDFNDL